ncbi:hypothetical protein D623_10014278 [Myotis brandtii]|uniref:Uncharacterized protein n=1 Tax=Myotis brandtii TaxID=109478 RepID=S7NDL2_MYOBR|nr:hypothetical protein D623_10014278 [Myotis brandtii]
MLGKDRSHWVCRHLQFAHLRTQPSGTRALRGMGLEERLAPGPRLGTQRGQGLVPRLQQQQLKQQSMVLEEPEFSLVLVLEVPAFLVGLVQFLGLEALEGSVLLGRRLQRQLNLELLEAWYLVAQELEFLVLESLVLGSQVLESQVLEESQVLGSQVLGSQVLESQVLEESQVLGSQVLESQGLCHQLQLLKQPPKQPNMGPEPEWELEVGLVQGAFRVTAVLELESVVLELESEVSLELAFPLQPRQPPPPRQLSMVAEPESGLGAWELVVSLQEEGGAPLQAML